jgi:16S rRNA (cytosine967-C5)-methyltransferase
MPENEQKTMRGLASRKVACEILIKVESEGAYANIALNSAFKHVSLSEPDRAFVTALVQGVLRQRDDLDFHLAKYCKKDLAKMPRSLRNTLRLALFQIEQMPDIPARAVVSTACELAGKLGHKGHVSFVNGVLRNYLRAKEKTSDDQSNEASDQDGDSVEIWSRKYSMPDWLVKKWRQQFGDEQTKLMLEASNRIPNLTLRAVQTAITAPGLQRILENAGVTTEIGKLVDTCLVVHDRGRKKGPIEKITGYDQGLFVVQDQAASFVSIVVDPKPGEVVIDLCAAPGGKSLHMADMMEGRGRVIACDQSGKRLNMLKTERTRLSLTNIEIVTSDGTTYEPEFLADRILIDAPCTGTGVINKRADLRFNRQMPDLERLITIQRKLLHQAAKLVKPGGILVYSTCSVEPEENQENFAWFLDQHKEFEAESLMPFLQSDLISEWDKLDPSMRAKAEAGSIQLLPSLHGTSGFFIFRAKRHS